jgi:hypothetical protein
VTRYDERDRYEERDVSWDDLLRRSREVNAPSVSRLGAVRGRLAALEAELARLERFPEDDPYEDDAVLKIYRRVGGTLYTYAAVRVQGLWYLTGQWKLRVTPQKVPWAALVELAAEAEAVVEMTELRYLVGEGPVTDGGKTGETVEST